MLWRWSERDGDHEVTPDVLRSRVVEAFTWTDEQAREFLSGTVE